MTSGGRQELWTVELMRGLAAILVLVAHAVPAAGGWSRMTGFTFTGVDLFFVITGFVFGPAVFSPRAPSLVEYACRRLLRIYPLYLLALASYIGLRLAAEQPVRHVLEHLFFLHTMQTREIAFHFNPAFWSLPPEVEFYLLVPLLRRWLAGSDRRLVALFLAALAARGALSLAHGPSDAESLPHVASVHLPGLLVEFLVGMLVWRSQAWRRRSSALGMAVVGAVAWLGLAMLYAHLPSGGSPLERLLVNGLGLMAAVVYGLLLHAVATLESAPVPQAWKRFGIALGNISYPLYLWHTAVVLQVREFFDALGPALQFGIAVAILVPLCWGLHHAVEAPTRRLGRRLGAALARRQQVPIAPMGMDGPLAPQGRRRWQ